MKELLEGLWLMPIEDFGGLLRILFEAILIGFTKSVIFLGMIGTLVYVGHLVYRAIRAKARKRRLDD